MPNLTLSTVQDAYISQLFPDMNFGHDSMLFCGKLTTGASIYRDLIKFDISSIPDIATIESATLKLYITQNNVPSLVKPTKVYNLLSSFNENTITYTTQPAFDPTPAASLDIVSQINAYLEWDITSLVRDWHIGNIPNYGLILRGLESAYSFTGFTSKDYFNPAKHPILEISYSEDTGIIEYVPEDVTSTGTWAYSTAIPLGGRTATFGIENLGPKEACIILQLSPDNSIWIDDHSSSLSLCQLNAGDNLTLTTNGYLLYTRLRCIALDCVNPGDHATIRIYKTIKY
ncbi:DNRLRE domain-containing protein [Clostridium sp. ZS2-4]|uniref:DNRLRE domain-containing protein n=1 Tax=Clostridium sp. ZS2-4 TaxID=2987703 RepID=UPI00227CF81D|nr:DNRLRE domain-containing protein [Clostridium sp. ZS2-4]MCY6353851.1 DNRLRE domain-containing protein [Clostridium sp. ZS2-4]